MGVPYEIRRIGTTSANAPVLGSVKLVYLREEGSYRCRRLNGSKIISQSTEGEKSDDEIIQKAKAY